MRYFILIYNGFVWGLLTAIIAFNNQWLEMRINIGYLIPAVMLVVLIAVLTSKKTVIITGKFTAVNLFLCFILTYGVLGTKRLTVVPAAIIREAIKMTDVKFAAVNLFLVLCLTLGLITILLCRPKGEH